MLQINPDLADLVSDAAAGLAERRRELVHDAAGDMGEIVFGFLAEQGLFAGVENRIQKTFQKGGGRTLEGGRRRQTRAAGDRGKDVRVKAGDMMAAVLEATDDAADVVRPFRLAGFL